MAGDDDFAEELDAMSAGWDGALGDRLRERFVLRLDSGAPGPAALLGALADVIAVAALHGERP